MAIGAANSSKPAIQASADLASPQNPVSFAELATTSTNRITALDDRAKRRRQLISVMQDVFRDRSDRRVSESRGRHIAAPVALSSVPARVVRFTVAFDDQPTIDDEVDPPHPGNALLHTNVASERAEDESHERFGAGLRPSIEEPVECSVTQRKTSKYLPQFCFVDKSPMPCAVERRDRGPRVLAPAGLREGLNPGRDGGTAMSSSGAPVCDDVVRARGQPARAIVELDVERRVGCDEDACLAEQRDAVQPASEACRFGDAWWRIGGEVLAAPHAKQLPGIDQQPDAPFRQAVRAEVRGLEYPMAEGWGCRARSVRHDGSQPSCGGGWPTDVMAGETGAERRGGEDRFSPRRLSAECC